MPGEDVKQGPGSVEPSLEAAGAVPLGTEGIAGGLGASLGTSSDVRRRAARGTALLGVRSVVIMGLSLAGNAVLARLLPPRDFGIIALAAGLVVLASIFTDGGMAAGLVGREQEPARLELESALGLQLTLAVVVAAAMGVGGLLYGGTAGRVTALTGLVLPLSAYRSPAAVVLERQLAYRALAIVEVSEAVVYLSCALSLVVAGAGVWGLAAALVARSGAGSISMGIAAGTGWLRPRAGWGKVRAGLAFGARFQGIGIVLGLEAQGINVGTVSIAGAGTLGTWSLVIKLMQVPAVLFSTLWRVAFPATARLLEAGDDPGPVLERGLKVIGVTAGALIAGLVGSAPALVPVLFGRVWDGAVPVLPWVGLALMLNGPISAVSAGYLCARGDASTVLRGTLAHAVVWLTAAFLLLPYLGAPALGVGMVLGTLAGAVVVRSGLRRWAPVRVLRCLLPEVAAVAVAATAGWMVAYLLGSDVYGVLASGAVTAAVFAAVVALTDRSAGADALRLGGQAIRRAPSVGRG